MENIQLQENWSDLKSHLTEVNLAFGEVTGHSKIPQVMQGSHMLYYVDYL